MIADEAKVLKETVGVEIDLGTLRRLLVATLNMKLSVEKKEAELQAPPNPQAKRAWSNGSSGESFRSSCNQNFGEPADAACSRSFVLSRSNQCTTVVSNVHILRAQA
jgi:hypothetical protein